jgi:hypothetical protein
MKAGRVSECLRKRYDILKTTEFHDHGAHPAVEFCAMELNAPLCHCDVSGVSRE